MEPFIDLTVLGPNELEWRDKQQFLERKGYLLPSRYRVGWKPSWKANVKNPSKFIYEDAGIGLFTKVRLDPVELALPDPV